MEIRGIITSRGDRKLLEVWLDSERIRNSEFHEHVFHCRDGYTVLISAGEFEPLLAWFVCTLPRK